MGFAGAEAKPEYILLAGVAGLLAGAFSMAAGEYVSIRAQREVLEQHIALLRVSVCWHGWHGSLEREECFRSSVAWKREMKRAT